MQNYIKEEMATFYMNELFRQYLDSIGDKASVSSIKNDLNKFKTFRKWLEQRQILGEAIYKSCISHFCNNGVSVVELNKSIRDSYALHDSRIKVLTPFNGGLEDSSLDIVGNYDKKTLFVSHNPISSMYLNNLDVKHLASEYEFLITMYGNSSDCDRKDKIDFLLSLQEDIGPRCALSGSDINGEYKRTLITRNSFLR